MKETLGRRRAAVIVATIVGLSIAGLLAAGCKPRPFAPLPGLAEWRAPAAFAVRDGLVDLPGGNLLLHHTDLSLETRLGPQAVTHTYSSATDRWHWSFEMTYAAGVFSDDTGARHDLAAAPAGPIPGTRWRKVDGATIESRGGLRFSFAPFAEAGTVYHIDDVVLRPLSDPLLALSAGNDLPGEEEHTMFRTYLPCVTR